MTAPLKTFIIYSSADRELRDEFERHIKPLVDLGWLSLWSDKEIAPGEQWDSTIKRNLHNADIFLMLVSVDFYNSGYIREEEFKTAISRLENGDSLIIPIIVRDCPWKYFPVIKDLQVLPPEGKAVTDLEHWKTRDKAWSIVVERIGDRIETLHADRKAKIQARKVEDQRLTDEKARREQQERIQRQQQEQARREREAKEEAQRAQAEKEQKIREEKYRAKLQRAEESPTDYRRWGMYGGGTLLAAVLVWFLFFREKTGDQPFTTATQNPPATQQAPTTKSGLEMVQVQGGTFMMGSPASEEDRRDNECQHQETVGSFSIGKYEVTQADWLEIMGTNPSEASKNCDECPVDNVSWDDVQQFIQKLNAKTGKTYRLPTEAEWEYAARGGNASKGYLYSGSNTLFDVAWYSETTNRSGSKPAGTKQSNELGLYDLSGNVYEWCQDTRKPYPCDTKTKADGSYRVCRGGSWGYDPQGCRVANRSGDSPGYRGSDIGFRLARTL